MRRRSARSSARTELDPSSPMPLWGIAYALGPNYNLRPAGSTRSWPMRPCRRRRAGGTAPARERAYVEALAARYSSDPNADLATLAQDFSARMKALSEALSRRSRRSDDLRREHDEPQPVEAVDAATTAGGQDRGHRRACWNACWCAIPAIPAPTISTSTRSRPRRIRNGRCRRPSGWRPSRRPRDISSTCRRTSTCWSATTRRPPTPT